MGFNFNSQPEYRLNTSLAEEMINLYGVETKFIIAERINRDDNVFGDYSHLKTDSEKVFLINMLPENSEDWDQGEYDMSAFGLVNTESVVLFVAKSSFENIADLSGKGDKIIGNLITFPNNKTMEITDVDATVPGINNLFTYNDAKSVYKLTCKPYDFKLIHEVEQEDISYDGEAEHETLDQYFDELIDNKNEVDNEANVKPQVKSVDTSTPLDQKVDNPIIDNTEKDVWGNFS